MTGWLRLCIRFPLVILCILVTLLLMSIGSLFGARRINRKLMRASFRTGAFLFGVRVHVLGEFAHARPLLLVSNHFSYLDLLAIGSKIPAAFTPKSEIAGWPVIGTLCRAAGCLFIDRRASKTMESRKELEKARRDGDIICLFPEGTTNEGHALLPFKSSFFSIADDAGLTVQPMSVVYTHLNARPLARADLPVIGWYGDMQLLPHVIAFLKQHTTDVTLIFHASVRGNQFKDRKELASYCRKQVEQSFTALLPGIFSPCEK